VWLRVITVAALVVVGVVLVSRAVRVSKLPAVHVAAQSISDSERVAAMLSIHANARFHDVGVSHAFIPLAQAVSILRHDDGPAADSRRRRAVAKLAAYGLDTFQNEIDTLAAPHTTAAEIRTYLVSALGAPLPSPAILERLIVNYLAMMTAVCKWNAEQWVSGGVTSTSPIEWNYTLKVPRDIPTIARALDPQSWDECSPLFQNTYYAQVPATCCSGFDAPGCNVTVDPTTGAPPPAPSQPPSKPISSDQVLYEDVCQDAAGECAQCAMDTSVTCDLSFRNYLCTHSDYDPPDKGSSSWLVDGADSYSVHYTLGKWLSTELYALEHDELTADQGDLEVRHLTPSELTGLPPANSWSGVVVTKHLEFGRDPSGFDADVLQVLQAYEDEMGGHFAEIVCCPVAKQTWGWPPWLDISGWFSTLFGSGSP